jgi:Concanavalin A-like lectin/glucanases superfamily
MKYILMILPFLLFFLGAGLLTPPQAQYKFNRSGHTATIDQSGGDTTITLDAEAMSIDGTGRIATPGGVKLSEDVTCASAADVGGIRLNSVAAAPPTSGLIAYWKLNESGNTNTAADSAGTFTGTLFGFPADESANWVTGKVGNALEFDGSDDRLDMSGTGSLHTALPLTFAAWIYADLDNDAIIMANDFTPSSSYYGAWLALRPPRKVEVGYGDGTGCTALSDTRYMETGINAYPVGQWVHLVGIIRGQTDMSIYVNGVDYGTLNPGGSGGAIAYDGSQQPSMGNVAGTCNTNVGFDGKLDDVRMYNRALSPGEVEALYNYTGTNAALQVCDGSG